MTIQGLSRRNFLSLGLTLGVTAAASAVLPGFSLAEVKQASLDECLDMSPLDMAKQSKVVMDSHKYLMDTVGSIQDPDIRAITTAMLESPAPTLMEGLMDETSRKAAYDALAAQGYVEKTSLEDFLPATAGPVSVPQPFLSAPGSGYQSHHSYPGGVVTHTALNLMASLALFDGYKATYGIELDRDVVIASQALHDLHKPWVFQWGVDGESRTEHPLAGTGQHHPLSVAESIQRGLPARVCVAQACAHNHPGFPDDEAGPVSWIKAACTLLGKDPVAAGLLAEDGQTLPLPRSMESFICHLGDHDWVLTVPAAKWMIKALAEIGRESYGMSEADIEGRKFNALRNYVFSQATAMTLYAQYSTEGKDALTRTVLEIVKPA